jgi:lipopolysaccharide exporter
VPEVPSVDWPSVEGVQPQIKTSRNSLRRKLRQWRNSRFVQDVATLAGGITAAQAVAVAAAPVLTRLYTPNDLGIFALFASIGGGFTIAASWQYEMAIALPKSEADAANLLGLSCLIVVLMSGLAAVTLIFAGGQLIQALGVPELGSFLALTPITVLVIGLYPPLTWWAARRGHYRQSAVSQIFRSAGGAGAQIAFGLVRSAPAGLIIGNIMGQLAAVGLLAAQLWRKDGRLIAASLNLRDMWRVGRDQCDFPKFSMPKVILFAMTATVLPPVLLGTYFGAAAAGAYWLAYRVCQMPLVVLGEAIRQVFYQKAAAQFGQGEGLLDILTKSTVGLVVIVVAPLLITVFYGPTLFGIVFGEEWTQAGIYSRWLSTLWSVTLICAPSTTLVPIYGYQRLLLIFETLTQVPRLAIIPLVSYLGDDVTAVAIYSVAGVIFQLCILVFVFSQAWRRQGRRIRAQSVEA